MTSLLSRLPSRWRVPIILSFSILALGVLCKFGLQNHFFTVLLKAQNRVDWGKTQTIAAIAPQRAKLEQLVALNSRQVECGLRDGVPYLKTVAEKDIDGDGKPDRIEGGLLDLHIKTTRFGGSSRGDFIGHSGIRSAGFDDIDGDGCLDAWFCDAGDDLVMIYWGDGRGRFAARQVVYFGSGPASPDRAAFHDIDGDGRLDLIGIDYRYENGKRQSDLFWYPNLPLGSSPKHKERP